MELRRMSAARNRKTRKARRPLALEMMERRQLLATLMVLNNGDAGTGSLRQAITDANSNPGNDVIHFDLPNNELTIQPLTPLPTLTDPGTTLDATSQPNYNKLTGQPSVVLDGSLVPTTGINTYAGFTVTGGNCTIKGLVIENFKGFFSAGISLSGSPGDVVQDCYIGTGPLGTTAAGQSGDGIDIAAANCTIGGIGVTARNVISGNSFDGIKVTANHTTIQGNYVGLGADGSTVVQNFAGINLGNSVGNQIGGTAAGTGNVISGNVFDGIDISSGGITADVIQGNLIGTDATGTVAASYGTSITDGINDSGGASNTIGGIGAAGNVISGNSQYGIVLSQSTAQNNLIAGNKIGVAKDGTTPVANKADGVRINGAINDVIGGAAVTLGNVIAFNGSSGKVAGVNVVSGQGIEILSNSIHDNANGGIALSPKANADQPAPVITLAQTAAGQTEVAGTLNVNPSTGAGDNFTIQFFSNPTADSAGLFEGQTLIGQTTVTPDINGTASFDVRLPIGSSVGASITATATQQVVQNTSVFSAPATVVAAPTTDLVVTNTPGASPLLFGNNETYTVTVANTGTTDDTNVVYTGLLDNNSTFVQATASQLADPTQPPTFSNGTVTAKLGTITAGQTVTVTIIVTPISPGSIGLTSTAVGDIIDLTPSNNTNVTTTVAVNPAADLSVQIDSSPSPVAVGGNLAYVVTVINNGPSDAPNVIVTDTLPASVTLVDVNPSQGFTQNGNVLTFQLGDIPAQGSATITIDVTPNQDGQITDNATVRSDVADPNLSDNSKDNVTTVEKAVDLALSASAAPVPGTTAQPLTYNLSVSNAAVAGSSISDATAVIVTDTLPANIDPNAIAVAFGQNQGSYTIANGVVTINFGAIAVGQAPLTAAITVTPLSSGFYTNVATVSDAAEINVGTTPTSVTTTVPVSPSDLSVTVVANPGTAAINAPLTYTVTVTNGGPADAPGVVLADALPASIAANPLYFPSQGGASLAGSRITANLGTILSGHSATLTIVVTPTLSGPIDDIAGTASANVDPNTANNLVAITTLVSPVDLIVAGVASTKTPIQGDPVVYAFTVYNAGPAPSAGTGINIAIPANSTYVSSFTTQGFTGYSPTFNILSAAIGNLAPGSFATVFVTVIPTTTGAFQVIGTASTTNYNTNAANNFAAVTSTATNFPGTFALSSSSYAGFETAGVIPITIDRLNGTLGAIDVSYTTAAGSAVAGVNFTTTTGTVQFAAGQTSATVLVPVKHDGLVTANLNFTFAITGVDDGGSIGSPAAANVTVVNTDRDLTPPLVVGVVPVVSGNSVLAYVIDFSKPLDPARASNPNNYGLFLSGRDLNAANAFVPVAAYYNASNFSVTLIPSRPVVQNAFYGLIINGANAGGLTDLSGNFLDGAGSGFAATNYGALIGYGTHLSYYDAGSDLVSLATSGAQMEVVRNFSGNAYEVELFGNAGHAAISGSVRGGSTSISEIDGLGPFGSVNANGLSTPPFFVAISNFNASLPVPQSLAAAVQIGNTIPNGPAYVLARLKAKSG